MNEEWAAAGRPALDIGVGVNTGDMVAGNIGSETIMSYTVIGDNVNLGVAARVAEQGLPDADHHQRGDPGRLKGQYDIRPLGSVTVKGKTRAVDIFEVVVPSPLPAEGATGAGLSAVRGHRNRGETR